MVSETETPIKIPYYAKDVVDNIRATRRSKVNGRCIDKKILSQANTVLLVMYSLVINNERYKEILSMEFDMELIKKLIKNKNG